MRWAQRDSPEEPCTRASSSPEGEVCLFRDFPGGNQKGGLQGPPGMNCPTCPLLFSGLGLWLCPPTLSLSLRTIPQPHLDLQSKALRPSPLCSLDACSGSQTTPDCQGFTGRPHLAFTPHTWPFSRCSFLCSRADCQPPTGSSKFSSNVKAVFFDLFTEGESHLPLGSVPPSQSVAT